MSDPRAPKADTQAQQAIGVFDSGVGGLSVLREIRRELPAEDLWYLADSDAAPYGDRPAAFIRERARTITAFFVDAGVKAVVVACNTATAVAVRELRETFTLPIVAIEPALKPAAELTRSGVVGVLATTQTLAGENLADLVARYGQRARMLLQACPGLVEQVEHGDLSGPLTEELVARYVRPLLEQHADTIVLGCTHYPFLLPVIRACAGPDVTIVDPAVAVARQLRRRLDSEHLLSTAPRGRERFWTTGRPAAVQPVVAQLWGDDVTLAPARL